MPDVPGATPLAGCPICGRPTEPTLRPFCSRRCADIDLGRWFSERYRVPAPPAGDESEDEAELP